MIDFRLPRPALWVAIAAAIGLAAPALAQQTSTTTGPTKPKKTATKPAPKKPAPGTTASVSAAAQPTLLGQYGEWGAYAAVTGGNKVCFALSKPLESRTAPPNRPRDPAYIFVSSRPAENVRNEVSVMIGYTFKSGSDANIEIGPAKFALNTQSDGGWLKNAGEEAHMVDVMRKSADLTVTGTSARGTQSTDRYSLKGLSQALDRAGLECK